MMNLYFFAHPFINISIIFVFVNPGGEIGRRVSFRF